MEEFTKMFIVSYVAISVFFVAIVTYIASTLPDRFLEWADTPPRWLRWLIFLTVLVGSYSILTYFIFSRIF